MLASGNSKGHQQSCAGPGYFGRAECTLGPSTTGTSLRILLHGWTWLQTGLFASHRANSGSSPWIQAAGKHMTWWQDIASYFLLSDCRFDCATLFTRLYSCPFTPWFRLFAAQNPVATGGSIAFVTSNIRDLSQCH